MFLQRHPFPVVAHFERVVAVTFAFPEAVLRPLVPGSLEIDGFEGWGFVAVAMVWTRALRPAGFPRFLGSDFFLAGYRIFCRLREPTGRRLRGLQILRSETDRRRMVWSGNLLTRYHYRRVNVLIDRLADGTRVTTALPDGRGTLDLSFDDTREAPLPPGSPLKEWREARRFSGPMPFTFSALNDGRVVVVEGQRAAWRPRPIAVHDWQVALFAEPPFGGTTPVLANAFAVESVDYRWSKGRIVNPGGRA